MTSIEEVATDRDSARPMRKDAARNRELLVRAAREVFAERGFEASLDDIAKHAGLGVGTAYRHFANKFELAEAIFTEALDGIVELAEAAAVHDDPWQGLVMFLAGMAEVQATDRGLREVLMGTHDVDRMEQFNERLAKPLRDMVGRARDAGAIRPDVEVSDFAVVVMMLCTAADITSSAVPDLWRRYLPMLLEGLRPGPELPVPAISEEALRLAMTSHKQRMLRVGQASSR